MVTAVPAQADEVYPRPWDNTVILSGHGYGHGHGMSQWGAYGAAKVGNLAWPTILSFYYPGTTLTKFANTNIRVRLDAVGNAPLQLPNAAGLQLTSPDGTVTPLPQVTTAGTPITRYRVVPRADGRLQVDQYSAAILGGPPAWTPFMDSATPAVFSNPSRGNLVDVRLKNGSSQRTYRGAMYSHWRTATTLTAVSVLPIESYLRAVVPAEMPSSWHPNALAAQAVAARSYASRNRADAPSGRVHDTCDTTSCQMYSGLPAEAVTTDAAIEATSGQTLTYQGVPAFTQFAASNGGWSSSGGKPYLVAKADPYDGAIPNGSNSWTKAITAATIEAKWPSIGSYRRLRISSRDGNGQWGGRVLQVAVEGSAGTISLAGTAFRTAFGLKSEWFVPTNLRSAPSYPRDFTRDKKADVLAVVDRTGYLRMYPGNGASGWGTMKVVGTGFRGYAKVFTAGTWDIDGISDVLAQKADGTLWLHPGTAAGPLGAPRRVGSGWGSYNVVIPVGDFGGDGLTDLLGRRSDGRLMLFSGNGSGGFLGARLLGPGWGVFTAIFSPGDLDGDAKSDVIVRASDGSAYLYPGNGTGGFLPRRDIGTGWNTYSALFSPGDFSGDGLSDVLARSVDGRLWLHTGDGVGGLLPRQLVGSGWNIFSTVLP